MVTIPDFDALKGPITDAVARGIPVITVNSGTHEESEALGALLHVGQPEFDAGKAGGERAAKDGVKTFLCVNHFISSAASTQRCQGFAAGLDVELGSQMIDSGTDPSEVKNKVLAYLSAHPNTDAILTLGPASAGPTIEAVKENGMAGAIHFGTFDLSDAIADALKGGTILWAVDQQPYLQGFLPVALMTAYNRYGVIPPDHINSGPGFITKDTIDAVSAMAGVYR
jgi:simple sugar transport system substrate-binding protein